MSKLNHQEHTYRPYVSMKPQTQSPLHIRAMQPHELGLGIDWAAQEGWNPGLHDVESFYAADPKGFLLAEYGDEPVGMISAVCYGETFGFIGFYLVRPAFRGKGFGLALWNAAIERLSGRLVGLDGVVAQQANYRKSGFVLAYKNVRMQGIAHVIYPTHPNIVTLDWADLERVLQYDAALFPAERTTFVRHWIKQTASVALGLMDSDELRGYGVIRPCQVGYKVGPLFADDAETARHLLNALMGRIPHCEQVQIDMATDHIEARATALLWNMQPVFETARMYTSAAPSVDLRRQYGITTFELG